MDIKKKIIRRAMIQVIIYNSRSYFEETYGVKQTYHES
jgi:hypothetical protein